VTLEPQGIALPFVRRGDTVTVKVAELIGQAMLVAERKSVSTA
jgi:hypothetical protein